MLQRNGGRILNTASVAGFMPGPLQATYYATEAFVLSWGEALATELDDTPISVTALCPGVTDTDFFPKGGAANKAMIAARRVMPVNAQAKLSEKMNTDVPPEDRTHQRGEKEAIAMKE